MSVSDLKDVGAAILDPGNLGGQSGKYGGGVFDPAGIAPNSQKKNAPASPDYYGAAQGASASSQNAINQQTQNNRPNQNTGFGSQSWTQGPNGQWTQNTSLNQPLGSALSNLQNQAYTNSQTPFDNGTAARDQAITGAYNQATSRLDPRFAQESDTLRTQLANQGLDPDSAASGNAMSQFGRDKNDAYSSAMSNAIAQGTAAQQATFNENMQTQMAPYQQMQALQGFQNGLPGFNAAGAYQPIDYLDAANLTGNYNMAAWNGENQGRADAMSGIGSFTGKVVGGIAGSDERFKQNIKRLDEEAMPGVPVALFEYLWQPGVVHRGVIAQDLEKVAPQYVHKDANGMRFVDYSFARKPHV